jgi:probable rRNA maturation factor
VELIVQSKPRPPQPLPWSRAQVAAQSLLDAVGRPDAEISVLLTDDAGIRALNREWRAKDHSTDVLSWPLAGPDEVPGPALGDIAISLDTASRQAERRGWALADELALLLIHGILHLLGHEDDTQAGSERMRAIETRILGQSLDPLPLHDNPGSG